MPPRWRCYNSSPVKVNPLGSASWALLRSGAPNHQGWVLMASVVPVLGTVTWFFPRSM